MSCPFLEKVVMLQCRACPVRKLVPMNSTTAHGPCFEGDFRGCRLFLEAVARLKEPAPHKDQKGGPR